MENEYLNLPDDPEEAFASLHFRKLEMLEDAWRDENHRGVEEEIDYMETMKSFDEIHDLKILSNYHIDVISEKEFYNYFRKFLRHVSITSKKILMESARRQKAGFETIVVFEPSQRTAIHHLINKIRDALNNADLTDEKRDSLFNKLNAFAAEVDRDRTRAEAFFAFAIDVSAAARKVNDELKPLQKTIDKIFDWIEKGKKLSEALPPWSERKQIEPPRKQLPKPNSDEDEIPF